MFSRSFAIAFLLAFTTPLCAQPELEEAFERQVRPVLITHCLECHGPNKQESELRLDTREAILNGGASGAAIIVGKPQESLLIQAVERHGDLKMPPQSPLSPVEIDALRDWVRNGAVWPSHSNRLAPTSGTPTNHWAFQPPIVRIPPDHVAGHHPIDAFWLEKLAVAGLQASPVADRATLIRRVTMDLIGLRPTEEEVQAFVNDPDPLAYEKRVDRLLNSPAFGEHWARAWLDLTRYSTTKGYVYAREQRQWIHASHYRDWVIRAFNQDMPYDRFLVLQIAADLAAPDEPEAQAAMGFLTLGRRFLGIARDIIDDRIDVLTRTTMGLTVACARCHDHKYDPISTRDYYALYGVFLNSHEAQVALVAPDEQAMYPKHTELLAKIAEAEQVLNKRRAETEQRIRLRLKDYLLAQWELSKYPFEGFDQIISKDDLLPLIVRRWETYLAQSKERCDPLFIPWHRFRELSESDFVSQASTVVEQLQKLPEGTVNPAILNAFRTPPNSRQEVAQRYAALFEKATAATDDQAYSTDGLEALRALLNDPYGPCSIPSESVVNIEYLFDTATCDELWKRQNEIDKLLLTNGQTPPHAIVLHDRPNPRRAQVFRRGNPATATEFVSSRMLPVIAGPSAKPFQTGSGRWELAQAIVADNNPLTSRVIVNRIWGRYFGAGFVRSTSDFGRRAESPSHPELLDWLAQDLVAHKWSLKRLHRLICLSMPYRQSHLRPGDASSFATAFEKDPENRLLWYMPLKRLSLEAMLDNVRCAADGLSYSSIGSPQDPFDSRQHQRSIYASIDRQFFPNVLRSFDVANPDLHIPERAETTVPQQALFFMNHPWVMEQANRIAARSASIKEPTNRVLQMHQHLRLPSPSIEHARELAHWVDRINTRLPTAATPPSPWQYGYGIWAPKEQTLTGFQPLPLFTGSAWQGSDTYPDEKLGWLQLTAIGGHPGNDRKHAVIRRWIAPRSMQVRIESQLKHEPEQGDGIHAVIYREKGGVLQEATLHHAAQEMAVKEFSVAEGEAIDFSVDIAGTLSYDQFLWTIQIHESNPNHQNQSWNSETQFQEAAKPPLDGWTQLAHALLMSNPFMFVD